MSLSSWRRVGLGLCALWFAACGADGRYIVLGTPRAPATSGTVEVDALDAGSTQVSIHLDYLHPPSQVARDYDRYLVWFLPKTGGKPVLGGQLNFDPAQRTGDLTATSPFRQFGLEITAERRANPAAPSDYVVASQDIKVR